MTNEEIVKEIQLGHDKQKNLLLLYKKNTNFIKKIAYKYTHLVELDDLMQEAYVILVTAVNYFDTNNDTVFLTFYGRCLKSGYGDLINSNKAFKMSETTARVIYKYKALEEKYLNDLGRYPTEQECKRLLDIGPEQLKTIKDYLQRENVRSLYEPIETTEDSDLSLMDTIPDDENKIEEAIEKIQQEELHEALCKALSRIDKQNADIISKYYFDGISYTQIAKDLGLTKQRVSQRAKLGLKALKSGRNARLLHEYLDKNENALASAYKSGYTRFNYNGSTTENLAIKLYSNEKAFIDALTK